ncbi:MAG: hypothetical protein V2I33_25350, partial [Kangiellaceae bacterium]|nr:hypothetical protein [Kangiellaceae bacterium]
AIKHKILRLPLPGTIEQLRWWVQDTQRLLSWLGHFLLRSPNSRRIAMHEPVIQAVYQLGKAIRECVRIETEHGRSNESDSGFETPAEERDETAAA